MEVLTDIMRLPLRGFAEVRDYAILIINEKAEILRPLFPLIAGVSDQNRRSISTIL